MQRPVRHHERAESGAPCRSHAGAIHIELLRGDPSYQRPARERRELFGIRMAQVRNALRLSEKQLENVLSGSLTPAAKRDLVLGLITLKYTQSNSAGYSLDGQMIGIGAG